MSTPHTGQRDPPPAPRPLPGGESQPFWVVGEADRPLADAGGTGRGVGLLVSRKVSSIPPVPGLSRRISVENLGIIPDQLLFLPTYAQSGTKSHSDHVSSPSPSLPPACHHPAFGKNNTIKANKFSA